jgi:hypothetical protein
MINYKAVCLAIVNTTKKKFFFEYVDYLLNNGDDTEECKFLNNVFRDTDFNWREYLKYINNFRDEVEISFTIDSGETQIENL